MDNKQPINIKQVDGAEPMLPDASLSPPGWLI